MSIFSQVNMPLPGGRASKMPLRHNIVNSQEFGYLTPLLCREVYKGDNFTIKCRSFCRTSPLVVPTFADVNLDTHAFYVPARQLWRDAHAFFTNTTYTDTTNGVTKKGACPKLPIDGIMRQWYPAGLAEEVAEGEKYDFIYSKPSGSGHVQVKVRHTNKGKRILAIFYGLGYRFNFAQLSTYRNDTTAARWTFKTALPLLAYLHIYHEYFTPPMFYPNTAIQGILDRYSDWWATSPTSHSIDYFDTLCLNILNAIPYTTYLEPDYFTASWTNPTGYSNNTATFIRFNDGTGDAQIDAPANNANYPQLTVSGKLSDLALKALRGITNVVLRNSLAGNKYVDRMLARWGVRLPALQLQRPVFLGGSSTPVDVSDVMTTADTETGSTGDYKGKAVAGGGARFKVNPTEFGFVIVFSTIQPRAHLVQGSKPELDHTDLYDFYTPEFDKMGTQAIPVDQVYSEFSDPAIFNNWLGVQNPKSILGFVPRYSELKVGYDNLFGDFCINSRNTGLDAFHLFRRLDESWFGVAGTTPKAIQLGESFLTADPASPYNNFARIFSDTSLFSDNFVLTHEIDFVGVRAMSPIGESLLPDTDNLHPKTVSVGDKYMQ